MNKNNQVYLQDIAKAISKIEEYTVNIDFDKFLKEDMRQDAVIRQLEVIGEAANRISKDFLTTNPDFPLKEAIRMRNFLIEDGKIKEIGKINNSVDEIIDAQGKYILPGLVEVHGHLREPGFEQKEDIPHGTRAGIAGGFTSVIDMPNTKPPTTTVALLQDKIKKIYPGRSYIDYAFFMGVSKDQLKELEKVKKSDIVGIKVFTAGHETTP